MTLLLREESIHSSKRPLRGAIRLKSSPSLGPDSLFAKGLYTIQDESSQLIAHLVDPQDGDIIVDACSGPGGKLTHIYELSNGKAKIDSIESKTVACFYSTYDFFRLFFFLSFLLYILC